MFLGVVLLDQLVTIDYNARQWNYVETVGNEFLNKKSPPQGAGY
jgi:mRNA interferase MazF